MSVFIHDILKVVVLLICGFLAFYVGRRSAYWRRRRLSQKELEECFGKEAYVIQALKMVADMYEIPIGVLRPSDKFGKGGMLWTHDSWCGIGAESLDKFLADHGVHIVPPDWTVYNFVRFYGDECTTDGMFREEGYHSLEQK